MAEPVVKTDFHIGARMKYNPVIHQSNTIRLRGSDCVLAGANFITICTQDRRCLFGEIVDGGMWLNAMGRIVAEQRDAIPQRFIYVALDEFVVMPHRVCGIIMIVGAPLADAQNRATVDNRPPPWY